MIALILAAVMWGTPAPSIWICNPGKLPLIGAPSNCERLHFSVLGRFRLP